MKFAYYAESARRAGVPEMWVEDAAQDIAIRVWQANTEAWKRVVNFAAVDAARRYGNRDRHGRIRWPTGSLPEFMRQHREDTGYRHVERKLDIEREWPRLNPHERRAITKTVLGNERTTNLEQVRAYQGRLKLRRLCA